MKGACFCCKPGSSLVKLHLEEPFLSLLSTQQKRREKNTPLLSSASSERTQHQTTGIHIFNPNPVNFNIFHVKHDDADASLCLKENCSSNIANRMIETLSQLAKNNEGDIHNVHGHHVQKHFSQENWLTHKCPFPRR